jgi:hypothetical protein
MPRENARLCVLNWNLNAFTTDRFSAKLDLLQRLAWDVATLQELLPGTIEQVQDRLPDCSLVTRIPNETWPRPGVRRRCGILVRPSVDLIGPLEIECDGDQGIDGCISPAPREVLVAAEIELGGSRVAVVSAHPPHAAARDDTEREWRVLGKLRTYAGLARWATPRTHVVVGMDANAWVDKSPFEVPDLEAGWDDQAAVGRFFYEEPPAHGLHDAFRMWLASHPAELAEIRLRRPDGPLALTYVRGGSRPVADRFDLFMISRSLRVDAIEHNYEDAVSAGSDHAYVLAQLSLC